MIFSNKESNKKVYIKVRLSEKENEKLDYCSTACGLSQSEFIRQLCKGTAKVDRIMLKRRDEDLDTLFKRIYEDMVSGRLPVERFDKLSSEYETKQKAVKATILDLQKLIDSGEPEQHDLPQFLKNVRKYTDPEKLTAEILNDLIDKIVVHAPDKSNGHRKQKIEIYYKAAGIITIANEDCVALDSRQER